MDSCPPLPAAGHDRIVVGDDIVGDSVSQRAVFYLVDAGSALTVCNVVIGISLPREAISSGLGVNSKDRESSGSEGVRADPGH
jgi:hypothetical protein